MPTPLSLMVAVPFLLATCAFPKKGQAAPRENRCQKEQGAKDHHEHRGSGLPSPGGVNPPATQRLTVTVNRCKCSPDGERQAVAPGQILLFGLFHGQVRIKD
jgi:hypothetical protein